MKKLIGILIVVLLASIISAATLEETFKKEIPFIQDGEVTISNVNGEIEVQGWDKNTVLIRALKKIKAGSRSQAQKALEDLRIEITEDEDLIIVDTRYPKKRMGILDWLFGNGVSATVNYEVFVPLRSRLKIKTVNGAIKVKEVSGFLRAKTVNGSVKVSEISGEAQIETTNGGIKAELTEVSPKGTLEFVTVNGGIKVTLPEGIKARLRAKTVNGSIETEFPLQVVGKFTRKKINGEINGGGNLNILLETVNGSIIIRKHEADSWGNELKEGFQLWKQEFLQRVESLKIKLPSFFRKIVEKVSFVRVFENLQPVLWWSFAS